MQGPNAPKKFSWRKKLELGIVCAMSKLPPEQEAQRQRLIALRYYVAGENQTVFAKRIGIEVKRWNNFERGSPLSKDVGLLLCQKIPGMTLDWLFRGVETGLPIQLARELAEAGNKAISAGGRR